MRRGENLYAGLGKCNMILKARKCVGAGLEGGTGPLETRV